MNILLKNLTRTSGALRGFTTHWQTKRCFGQPVARTHPHLLGAGEVTPGISKHEFLLRRNNLMMSIAESQNTSSSHRHLVVIPSAPKVIMSNDIPYPFRQNTDFLYLCGFQEPDSILLLDCHSGNLPEHKSILFVPKKDPHRELWDGPRSGVDGAITLTGVDEAYNNEDFGEFLTSYLRYSESMTLWYTYIKPAHVDFHLKHMTDFMREVKFACVENPKSLIQRLRLVKSESEVKLMQKTCDIASDAFVEVMKYSYPNVNEAHLYAKMDYECRVNGADILAYPPVVAGGERANTIHYISNNQLVADGQLVLMDAGCECHGYTSDITRTWPVNGKFTSAQHALYEAVLEVQEMCIMMCGQPGITLEQIFLVMLQQLGRQLRRLDIISRDILNTHDLIQMARHFCPHHVGHYLGMDVHDTDEMSRTTRLQPGHVITIEPGLYIPSSTDNVPADFRGLGIRIEDNVLITDNEPHVLTSRCPKQPGQIEKVMGRR